MGVRGLKTFIERNNDLFTNDYHLHDTFIVVDAANLISALYVRSQKHERRDLFGGDMVQFGRYLNTFFGNLKKCNIEPILVFDGAQTYDENKSKTAEKHRRALDRFQNVLSISKCGFGDFILPATATNVFRSIAVDRDLRIIQCMFEADLEVARISNEYKCPVLSNDSDFLLMDLNHGVITIDLLEHEHVKRSIPANSSKLFRGQQEQSWCIYLECSLYQNQNFTSYLPHLDPKVLPLVGVLAGNDFIESKVFESICGRFSTSRRSANRQFKKTSSKSHEKIVKILNFLSGKTLSESVNQICNSVSKDKRQTLKKLIKSNLLVYNVPKEDEFRLELAKLYWPGYLSTYKEALHNDHELLQREFHMTISALYGWLQQAMEKSVLSYRCLELANNNIVFMICHLDDPQLPSAHSCQIRPMRVMLTLLRSSYTQSSHCVVYDRVKYKYEKLAMRPIQHLEDFGELNYVFYDVPKLKSENRRAILLATFHCSTKVFDSLIRDYYQWFDLHHAEEFLTVKLLMDYIDYENQQVRLWKNFRQATLLCMLYHYYWDRSDENFATRLDEFDAMSEEFMENLVSLIKTKKYQRMPTLGRKRQYNCRLMHQITQLQSSIVTFNGLNAFLGDTMVRIRTENWLNSCIIYNLAEAMHTRALKLSDMPEIVYNVPRKDKVKRVRI